MHVSGWTDVDVGFDEPPEKIVEFETFTNHCDDMYGSSVWVHDCLFVNITLYQGSGGAIISNVLKSRFLRKEYVQPMYLHQKRWCYFHIKWRMCFKGLLWRKMLFYD